MNRTHFLTSIYFCFRIRTPRRASSDLKHHTPARTRGHAQRQAAAFHAIARVPMGPGVKNILFRVGSRRAGRVRKTRKPSAFASMSAPASAAPLVSSVAPAVLVDAVPLLSAAAASVAAAPLPAAINDAPAASAAPGKSAPPAPVAAPVLVAATAAEAKDEERPLPQPKKRRTALPVEPLRSLPADVASAPSPAATQVGSARVSLVHLTPLARAGPQRVAAGVLDPTQPRGGHRLRPSAQDG